MFISIFNNTLFWYITMFALTCIMVALIVFFHYYFNNRYYSFVKKNSIAIKKIIELNKRYNFERINLPNLYKAYDNEKMFNDLSCYDFLVYNLQFAKNRQNILNIIDRLEENKKLYQEYIFEYGLIEFGKFDVDTYKLKIDKLIKMEKELAKKYEISPCTDFKLSVTLRLINMNNRLINTKEANYSKSTIYHIIELLKDKNGNFYNNREIWDSICKVERARVSNRMRFSIYSRDNYTCQMCHRRFNVKYLEIDHIYPIAKGGKSTYENLQTLCRRCNKEKGDKII